jgi:putative ABC transport system permease protein
MLMPHPGFLLLGRHHAGTWLLALQLAIGVVLCVHAWQTFAALQARRFEPSGIDENTLMLVPWIKLPAADDPGVEHVLQTLRAIPGVVSVAASNQAPYGRNAWSVHAWTGSDRSPRHLTSLYLVHEGFFDTLGLSTARGRRFLADEFHDYPGDQGRLHAGPTSAIVSVALAKHLYGDADPLGRTLHVMPGVPLHIVGVVDRIPLPATAHGTDGAAMVLPVRLQDTAAAQFVVRHRPDPGAMTARIRTALSAAYPTAVSAMPVSLATLREQTLRAPAADAWRSALACATWWLLTLGMLVLGGHRWIQEHAQEFSLRRAMGASGAQLALRLRLEYFLLAAGASLAALACMAWLFPLLVPGWRATAASPWTHAAAIAWTALAVQLAAGWPARLVRRIPAHLVSRSPSVRL